jgi:hypothetical protein
MSVAYQSFWIASKISFWKGGRSLDSTEAKKKNKNEITPEAMNTNPDITLPLQL